MTSNAMTIKTDTKMARRSTMFALLAACVALLLPATAQADEMSDLQAKFKSRFPKLTELRNAGTVGETWDGWVQVVKGGGEKDVAEIVAAENTDRKALYALLAAKQKTTPELVGERNGLRIFKAASADHWLKPKDGTWAQKKNVKIEG